MRKIVFTAVVCFVIATSVAVAQTSTQRTQKSEPPEAQVPMECDAAAAIVACLRVELQHSRLRERSAGIEGGGQFGQWPHFDEGVATGGREPLAIRAECNARDFAVTRQGVFTQAFA